MLIGKIKTLLRPIKKVLTKDPNKFLKGVSGVVHVGANLGQERAFYDSQALDVVWIEPIPEIYAQLEENVRGFKKQIALQALVTDKDGHEYEFHIANNHGASSSILALKEHKDIWPSVDYTSTVQLKSTTLTSLFKENEVKVSNYQALIMDTQGSELLVLLGSIPIINNFKFIKVEVADFEAYEGCCQLNDIVEFMREHGFKEHSRRMFARRAEGGCYYDIVFKRLI